MLLDTIAITTTVALVIVITRSDDYIYKLRLNIKKLITEHFLISFVHYFLAILLPYQQRKFEFVVLYKPFSVVFAALT